MRLFPHLRKPLLPLRTSFIAADTGFSLFHGHGVPRSGSRTPYFVASAVALGLALMASMPNRSSEEGDRDQLVHQANAGSVRAQLLLGLAYRDGRYGLARDSHSADAWFARAAESGENYAAALLGDAYAVGDGVAKDRAAAQRWWRQAAQAGNAHAESRLGQALTRQSGDQAGTDEGHLWLTRAAAQGDIQARHALGIDTPMPDRIPDEIDRDLGVTQGHSLLGNIYRLIFGDTTASGSADILKQRALAGDATAQYQLAMRYRDGAWGVTANPQKALGWLEQSANHGNPVAMTTLANAYETGRLGLTRDAAAASSWRQRAESARVAESGEGR